MLAIGDAEGGDIGKSQKFSFAYSAHLFSTHDDAEGGDKNIKTKDLDKGAKV